SAAARALALAARIVKGSSHGETRATARCSQHPACTIMACDSHRVVSERSPENPLHGSCLCGGVQFEITAPFAWASHCHCSRCRKHSGAFGLTQGRVPRDGFRLLQGEELITVYAPADEGRVKAFCKVCGSSLFGYIWPEGDQIGVRLGSLRGGPRGRPPLPTVVASKGPREARP